MQCFITEDVYLLSLYCHECWSSTLPLRSLLLFTHTIVLISGSVSGNTTRHSPHIDTHTLHCERTSFALNGYIMEHFKLASTIFVKEIPCNYIQPLSYYIHVYLKEIQRGMLFTLGLTFPNLLVAIDEYFGPHSYFIVRYICSQTFAEESSARGRESEYSSPLVHIQPCGDPCSLIQEV